MLKQFYKDSVFYGFATILSRGISIFLLPFYTRVLSPSDYGTIDIITIIGSLINVTIALEINQAIARYYAESKPEEKPVYVSTAFWFTISTYAIFLVCAFSFSGVISSEVLKRSDLEQVFRVSVFSMIGNGLFYFMQSQLRWQLFSKQYAITSVVFTLVSAGSTVVFILFFHTGVVGVFYGLIAGQLAGCLFGWYFARESYRFVFDPGKCRDLLRYSAPLVPASVATFVSLYINRIAINQLMSPRDVGIFGVGYRFASVSTVFMSSFQASLTPLIFENYTKEDSPREIAKIFRLLLWLILVFISFLALFSGEILRIFATPQYYPAAELMPVLAAAVILPNLYIVAPGLYIAKKTKQISITNIISAVLNVGLNFTLIPYMGIMGAAVSTLISGVLTFTLFMVQSQKHYYIPHKWKNIFISLCVPVIFIFWGRSSMLQADLHSIKIISLKTIMLIIALAVFTWQLVELPELKKIMSRVKLALKFR